ncbi:acyl-CoA thioesterase [Hyphomicrobium sp. CS1BSMeth3]|uniref:acyl-CoA thioesterase n=1 Tax=Hyphomicrobium sp. CS1BSMeth3 TaxID=1892844 RepID=UPI000931679A|nr:acyl-CoA thioesterase [Hyphomicrobium sp. CS1BSMeth3]
MQRNTNGVALLPPPTESIDDYPAQSTEKLRFADTDCNGHVTNSVFAICCQNARMEFILQAAGGTLPSGTCIAVARLELDFVGEMHWPGSVEIGTRVARIGQTSVTVAQAIFFKRRCVARSRSVAVLLDQTTRKATPLPPALVQSFREFGPPEEGEGRARRSLFRRVVDLVRGRS